MIPASPHIESSAVKLQKLMRGAEVRSRLAREMQMRTPYESGIQFSLANHLFSPRFDRATADIAKELHKKESATELASHRRAQAYRAYRSVGPMQFLPEDKRVGILHSFRQPNRFNAVLSGRQVPLRDHGVGNIYGPKWHEMLINSAWMLGLAHQDFPVALAARLDDTILYRRTYGGTRLSALPRELLGMLQSGLFTVAPGAHAGTMLVPTAKAKTASLSALKTPRSMSMENLKKILAMHGVAVERKAMDGPSAPQSAFPFAAWLTQVLAQDLDGNEADADVFPRLDVCLRSRIRIPFDVLRDVLVQCLPGLPGCQRRLAAFAMRVVEGVEDDAGVKDACMAASGVIPYLADLALRQRLIDGMLERIAGMTDRDKGNDLLRSVLFTIVEIELASPECNTGFPLLQRVLESRVLTKQYRYARKTEESMYSKAEVTDDICRAILQRVGTNGDPAWQRKAMRLAVRLLGEIGHQVQRYFALSSMIAALPKLGSDHARKAWAAVLLIMASSEDQDVRGEIFNRIGSMLEPGKNHPSDDATRSGRELVMQGIDMLRHIKNEPGQAHELKESLHSLAALLLGVRFGCGQLDVLFELCELAQIFNENERSVFAERLDLAIEKMANNLRKLGGKEAARILDECIARVPGLSKAKALQEKWIAQETGSGTQL